MSKKKPISIYIRGEIWQYSFSLPDGSGRVRESARTTNKEQALELATREYDRYWRERKLGEKPDYSWLEAVFVWLDEKPERKETVQYHLKWLNPYLYDKKLSQINKDLINYLKEQKRKEGVKNRTINAILQQIRGVLRCAYDNDMIDKVPSIKLLPEPSVRQVILSEAQEQRLIAELPPHLVPIVLFALATGLRMSNVTGLQWDRVDLNKRHAWVNIGDGKVKSRGIGVPLNSLAIAVLESQKGKHQINVFTYKGKPIKNGASKAWRAARNRAGLEHMTFHDLRHVWASRHAMNGTSSFALQDLGAWSKADTVRRYAHLSSAHLLAQSENSVTADTNLTRSLLH